MGQFWAKSAKKPKISGKCEFFWLKNLVGKYFGITLCSVIKNEPLNLAIMNAIIERQKRMLEATLGRVAGVSVEITFYKHNAISLLWDGALEQPFSRLQKYFSGKLEGEYYDTEDDFSVCYLQLN